MCNSWKLCKCSLASNKLQCTEPWAIFSIQLFKKFLTFKWCKMVITMLMNTHCCALPWASSHHNNLFQRSVLSSPLNLGSTISFYNQNFVSYFTGTACPTHLIILHLISIIIHGEFRLRSGYFTSLGQNILVSISSKYPNLFLIVAHCCFLFISHISLLSVEKQLFIYRVGYVQHCTCSASTKYLII